MLQNNKRITLEDSDITERRVDAIVNAANSVLNHGGGIALAIVRKGGWEIQTESYKIGYVPVGSAVITGAGRLPCKAVIHAVGPQMGEGDEDRKLRMAMQSILRLADENEFKSISIPAISSGIYEFPKDRCAKILIGETVEFLTTRQDTTAIEVVEFCVIDKVTLGHFQKEFALHKKKLQG
jgi:O-acetyl-ADP-ribose deacetylase (regulator of RNase III)